MSSEAAKILLTWPKGCVEQAFIFVLYYTANSLLNWFREAN